MSFLPFSIPPTIPPSGNFSSLTADVFDITSDLFVPNLQATNIDTESITVGNSTVNSWNFVEKLTSTVGTSVGYAVSLFGEFAYVGAHSGEIIVFNNGIQVTNFAPDSGVGTSVSGSAVGNTQTVAFGSPSEHVWIYQGINGGLLPSDWTQDIIIPSPNLPTDTGFGNAVSLLTTGTIQTLLIGQFQDNSGVGAVWVYQNVGSGWNANTKIIPSDNIGHSLFGYSVSLGINGLTFYALIGGQYDNSQVGAAWIYQGTLDGTVWSEVTKIIPSDHIGTSQFGNAVSLTTSSSSQTALIAGYNDNSGVGAAWIYQNSGSGWTKIIKLVYTSPTFSSFGECVSICSQNNVVTASIGIAQISVGGTGGAVLIYQSTTGGSSGWTQMIELYPVDAIGVTFFGQSTSIIPFGTTGELTVAVGGEGDGSGGAVWIYNYSPSNVIISDRSISVQDSISIGTNTYLTGVSIYTPNLYINKQINVGNNSFITSSGFSGSLSLFSSGIVPFYGLTDFTSVNVGNARQGVILLYVSNPMSVNQVGTFTVNCTAAIGTNSFILVSVIDTGTSGYNFSVNTTNIGNPAGTFQVSVSNVGPAGAQPGPMQIAFMVLGNNLNVS